MNDTHDQFDAANSEGHTNEEEPSDLVLGNQYICFLLFASILFYIQYLHLLLLYLPILLIICQCSTSKGSLQENHGSWRREVDKERKQATYPCG
jgi:hypothetical protein